MARLSIHINDNGKILVTTSDIEDVLRIAGLHTPTVEVEEQDDNLFTVDFYDKRELDPVEVDRFIVQFLRICEGLKCEIEQIRNFPMQGWRYAKHPVRY